MIKQFPIVKASGSHYEVGLAIGEAMREEFLGEVVEWFRSTL